MYVFIWRVCLDGVQKISSYDLKYLQELLPLLKATVSKSLVTFSIINVKSWNFLPLEQNNSLSLDFTHLYYDQFYPGKSHCVSLYNSNRFESFPCWDLYEVNCLQMVWQMPKLCGELQEHCRAPRAPPCAHTYTTAAPLLLVPKGGGQTIFLASLGHLKLTL